MHSIRNNESPNERFRRLATMRTNAILERLHLLGNLADKRNYQYNDEEVKKIFLVIDNKLKEVRVKFTNTRKKKFIL